jgi:eukaryotic-like serine/threonine-protein kinase
MRARHDPDLLLALAVALPVMVLELVGLAPSLSSGIAGALGPIIFVAAQVWLTSLRAAPPWVPTARLALSLTFVAVANLWADPAATLPLRSLALPVIAMAASRGGRGPMLIAVAGLGFMLTPLLQPTLPTATRQAVVAVVLAAVAVAIGSRNVVGSLERSRARLQRGQDRERQRARKLAAVESVGRVLARSGPTPEALDSIMGLLEKTFGYHYPSVYVWDGSALQLGAHRNYQSPIQTVPLGRGILGRVARDREPVFLPDARSDPDFLSADPGVTSEISIPLLAEGDLLGVLNVETNGSRPLNADDFGLMQIVADRLAASLALGRERQKLTERAALLDRLTAFSTRLGSSLDPATMDDEVAIGAATVIPADTVVLVNRDEAGGTFVINAVAGGDRRLVGRAVAPGEGTSGRALVTATVVVEDRMPRSQYPSAAAGANVPDEVAAMAAPMVVDDVVVGVVTWLRSDLSRPFTGQEQEVASLLAGKVGLALANARLHQQTADAAIRDPLTGLHNRRHFDAVMEREDAARRRMPAERRRQRSAILFDLDHFGKVNKAHGHQIGDRVLRRFAETLRARVRASDLVARYGGEEFVVILDDAPREKAATLAEEIRAAFGVLTVETGDGAPLSTSVSAGCASLEPWEVEGSLLLERADVALAMAKAAGRNQVVVA